MQKFTEQDIEQVLSDSAVTALLGWTEQGVDILDDDEVEYRRKLTLNHRKYSLKVQGVINEICSC